jgi:hypothetical protein
VDVGVYGWIQVLPKLYVTQYIQFWVKYRVGLYTSVPIISWVTSKLSVRVRVKPEVEEIVEKVSEVLGYMPYTVRNLSILLGVQVLLILKPRIKRDSEFMEIVKHVERGINAILMECEAHGEEKGEIR